MFLDSGQTVEYWLIKKIDMTRLQRIFVMKVLIFDEIWRNWRTKGFVAKLLTKFAIFDEPRHDQQYWLTAGSGRARSVCATQYEFIVVNGQTTTSAFHKVV